MMKLDIKNLFNPQHILHVGNMRAKFFASGSFDGITDVREEILHGWKYPTTEATVRLISKSPS